ncbi:MAG TPA: hypothetical protein DEE98_05415 [Elusimicrobia bacterium]|nr:MAG: hypothetical protein A2278_04050 [Elusimicrobia bacterium RIFOXYA12_FULL_49_49]OGS09044.1 MAG: hypothetical protein A2204_06250 [Elusimicrobia bacterium RIFOXYA1_FULL_47_7]OGS15331.1 MAG: hypothetical protein A2251_07365 [Elusimicrobia bacterium RIFOXYA2_FULL_47_53]OGS26461.1 MAG: hypothetical protein A2339_01700 [Elusimicrobia bacterium RIFOXYB12_FULL_50_12]OGS30586.1 MAG: hypothetical protein A2323_02485 [Elusimicrobia bacterium RIFOXYB2_FULL_46_23]HBU69805.1 hypothetical protein [El
MSKNLKICFAAALMLSAIFSTGCSSKKENSAGAGKQTEIRVAYWGAPSEKEIINKTISNWGKNNPGIKVVLEHIPSGTYTDKVLTEIAGGNPPDIIFCEVNIFVTFFYKNALLDLTPFLSGDKGFSINNFFPEVVSRFTRNGKLFCIPRDTAPFACIYYNKDLFEKSNVPFPKDNWDMNEFLATAKKLTIDDKGRHPGDPEFNEKKISCYGYWGWTWHNFVYSYGGKLVDDIDDPKTCLLDRKEAVDGVQAFVDLSYRHFVSPKPDALTNSGMSINQLFIMGRLAMFQSGIWETPNLRQLVGDKFKWDVAMFPKGPKGKRGFGTGGSGYAILKTCKNPKEAWEVVKCLAGDEGQEMLADTGLAQPANRKIAGGKHWAGDLNPPQNKKMLNEAVKYVYYEPFHPLWREASDKYIGPEMDLIVHNTVPVKEGLAKVAVKVNKILKQK